MIRTGNVAHGWHLPALCLHLHITYVSSLSAYSRIKRKQSVAGNSNTSTSGNVTFSGTTTTYGSRGNGAANTGAAAPSGVSDTTKIKSQEDIANGSTSENQNHDAKQNSSIQITGTIEPIPGDPLAGFGKHLIREITAGIIFGDISSTPALNADPIDNADIDAYIAQSGALQHSTMITPGNAASKANKLIRTAIGKGNPTKKGALGQMQPYDKKTGRYLSFSANPGLKYSPAASFTGGFGNGFSNAVGAGNPVGPTIGGMPARIGYSIGYAAGKISGMFGG